MDADRNRDSKPDTNADGAAKTDERRDETVIAADDARFESVIQYVNENMDFEPDSYNESYLDRRVSARMRRTNADTYGEYLEILSTDKRERVALLDALSINVTSFFRNPGVWERLRDVLRALTDEANRTRCWSAACADGREPYSIAMLARDDPEIDHGSIEITATDIDRGTIADARRGVYASTRTTDIASQLELLSEPEAHLEGGDDSFAVREPVKRMVSFERHDLTSGARKHGYDLVLCRNLLIYIDRSYKSSVVETLTDALLEGGYLVIGKSETLPREFDGAYEPFDRANHIYRRR